MERASKRQRLSPAPAESQTSRDDHDSEPTEFKLAILCSLHPNRSEDVLLDYLLAYDGSVNAAATALSARQTTSSPVKRTAVNGYQSSLSSFTKRSSTGDSSGPTDVKILTKRGRTLHLYVRSTFH